MNKEEISQMTKEEQIRQLEWSDQHEFSYWYAYYLLDYINQLETNIDEAIKFIQKTQFDCGDFNCCGFGIWRDGKNDLLEILERGKE